MSFMFSTKVLNQLFHQILHPICATDCFYKFSHNIFPINLSSNWSTKWSIQLFHTIFQQNFPAKFVHLIFQPNLANHFFDTIFNNICSPTPFTQLSHPTLPHNCATKLFYKNFYFMSIPLLIW